MFTTYQSSAKLAAVARKIDFEFDLCIFDEAHKTVGNKNKAFATLLFDDNIRVKRRLFMTATERVFRGQDDTVLSMDNDEDYGQCFHQLSFRKAIEDGPFVTGCPSSEFLRQIAA